MNTTDREREERLQALADRHEQGIGGASASDATPYRLVYRAVRAAPMPALPADFAARMERATRDHEEGANVEMWIVRVAMLCAIVVGAVVAAPAALQVLATLFIGMDGAPWPMLLAAALGIAVAWVGDSIVARW